MSRALSTTSTQSHPSGISGGVSSAVHHMSPLLINTIFAFGIYNFGWGFADPFFGQFLNTFSAHYSMLGFLASVLNGFALLMLIPVGVALESVSHRFMMNFGRFGYIIVASAYVCAGALHSLPLLILALALNGFFLPFVWTSVIAIIGLHTTKKNSSLAFGLHTSVRQLMWAVGLGCALVLLPFFPLYAIFVPVIICSILSLWYSYRIPNTESTTQQFRLLWAAFSHPRAIMRRFVVDARTLSRELWVAYGIWFLSYAAYIFVLIFLPLYVVSRGYSLPLAGMLVFVLHLPFIVSMLSSGFARTSERWSMIAIGWMIMAVGFCGLALVHGGLVSIAFWGFVIMCGYACIEPAIGGIISVLTQAREVGTSSALFDIAQFSSAFLAVPLIGMALDAWSWNAVFFGITLYAAIVCLVIIIIRRALRLADQRFTAEHPHVRKHPYVL